MPGSHEITALLDAHARGEPDAFDRLFEAVYEELRRVAHNQRRRGPGPAMLDTRSLVHELYLKLAGGNARVGSSREHFLAIAAQAMRHLLVDQARAAKRSKRGGSAVRVTLSRAEVPVDHEADRVLALDRGLERLAAIEPRQVRVVECRYFLGLSEVETASVLGVSESTVQREWRGAKRWLSEELGGREEGAAP